MAKSKGAVLPDVCSTKLTVLLLPACAHVHIYTCAHLQQLSLHTIATLATAHFKTQAKLLY